MSEQFPKDTEEIEKEKDEEEEKRGNKGAGELTNSFREDQPETEGLSSRSSECNVSMDEGGDDKNEENHKDDEVQVFWIMRHGDRLNNIDRQWKKTAAYPHDTPLSPLGHSQAEDVAEHIIQHDNNLQHVVSSPFLRALQTANPLSKRLNLPIKVEKSIWETGCNEAPPFHIHAESKEFDIDTSYTSSFEPACGENTLQFAPRLERAAAALKEKFPFSSGNVAIFSHADPCAYLVSALCNMDAAITAPVAPCGIFRLERQKGENYFRLTVNGSITHLRGLGKTEPCHPVHLFYDWCALLREMRESSVASPSFQWPPISSSELELLKTHWHERYHRLLKKGRSSSLPVIGSHQRPKKVCFRCKHCNSISYVRHKLMFKAPACHTITCWKCPGSFPISDIKVIPDPSVQDDGLNKV